MTTVTNAEIDRNNTPFYLLEACKQRFTGSMQVKYLKEVKLIYFETGVPVGSRSNLIDECLGYVLRNSGRITDNELKKSLEFMKNEKKRQGDALIELGYIRADELDEALRLQLRARIMSLFDWKGAEFAFNKGEVQKFIKFSEAIQKLVIEGLKKNSDEVIRELKRFEGKFIRKSDTYDAIIKALDITNVPFSMIGRGIGDVLNSGTEAAAYAYSFLLSGAIHLVDKSDDLKKLSEFYASIKDKNHFEVLGLSRGASVGDVKAAYRKIAKVYHPDFYDRHSSDEVRELARAIFPLVVEAFSVLSNKEKRTHYEDVLDRGDTSINAHMVLLADEEFKKGEGMLRFKNYTAAYDAFKKSIEYYAEDAETHAYFGWALFNKPGRTPEDAQKAKESVEKALDMDSKIAMAHYFLGVMLRVEGNLEKAMDEQNRALKLRPDIVEAQSEVRFITRKMEENKSGLLGKLFKK